MITIKEQANFKARDFFNYLDRQLTQAIKKLVVMTYLLKLLQEQHINKEM